MKLRSFSYFLDEALHNTVRNSLMSITSAITVSACVFMLVFLFCIAINVDSFLVNLEETTGVITVFIDDGSTNDQITALYDEIVSIDHVDKVEFISSKQAMENFKSTLSDNFKLLDGLENTNVLRRRFTVTLESGKYDDAIVAKLNSIKASNPTISSFNHFKDLVDKLVATSNIIRIICLFIILLLFFLAIVIIINTIKLAVNNRRTEIGIMKFIGATDGFIKTPFVIEGLIIGVAGSILPLLFLVIGYDRLSGVLTRSLGELGFSFELIAGIEIFRTVIPVAVIFGCIIGIVGSLVSIRRYLHV